MNNLSANECSDGVARHHINRTIGLQIRYVIHACMNPSFDQRHSLTLKSPLATSTLTHKLASSINIVPRLVDGTTKCWDPDRRAENMPDAEPRQIGCILRRVTFPFTSIQYTIKQRGQGGERYSP